MSSTLASLGNDTQVELSKFSSTNYIDGGREFLNSNSAVAKFAFLLLVVILFILLLRLGAGLMSWFMEPSPTPILIKGAHDATVGMTIGQNPNISGNTPILRSVNDQTGLEFTWSTWIYVDGTNFKSKQGTRAKYKHIFHKGNYNFDDKTGLNTPNNAPGLYLSSSTNSLLVLMNTYDTPTYSSRKNKQNGLGPNSAIPESIVINDLPLDKWVNVIIRISNQNQLDVYINGTLVKRELLKGIPRQNYGDVFVTRNGGFTGFISELRYFNSGIGTNKIQEIVDNGPNMKLLQDNTMMGAAPRYLSTRWFFSGIKDGYNP